MSFVPFFLAVVVGTWNGQWFPSGRAEHRASEAVEKATIAAAGEMIRGGLAKLDPSGEEDVILCLSEIRDRKTAEALCSAIGRTNLCVAIISGYRRRDRFDQQQNVIMTTLPVVNANWSKWKVWKGVSPPRGYAHVDVVIEPAVTASVYSVHLKSNYGQKTETDRNSNRLKRGRAIDQLVDQEKPKRGKYRAPVIIAGDMNADRFSNEFADETIFKTLESANFFDAFAGLDAALRITHRGRSKLKNGSTLDYIYSRGFCKDGEAIVVPASKISDHDAVMVRMRQQFHQSR